MPRNKHESILIKHLYMISAYGIREVGVPFGCGS